MLLIKHRNNNEQVILCVLGQGLRGINWKGANLQDADLHDANLEYADLEGADLRRANLRACYAHASNGSTLTSIRQAKTTKCNPATVPGSRS
jgi:uncharacterized protein YjbI with pentapeptide repeats